MRTITPDQLAQKQQTDAVDLIDVRLPIEFRAIHVVGARNIPLNSLDPGSIARTRNGNADQPLYVICQSGNRARMAAEKLIDAGLENIVNVEGGTQAWAAAGLPVVLGKKAVSLERQVRILAGFLVLIGAVLGYWVHPSFIGLSAFIGAGLMYAGITDTCGMGMMLAKMPWNQRKDQTSCCSTSEQ